MKNLCTAVPAALAILWCTVWPAEAQWLTQTNVIPPGWSAVYLLVDASSTSLPVAQYLPISPDNPIDQIWEWKTPVSAAQYVTTPESPLNAGGQWLTWAQTNALNSLSALIPNAAYLVHSSAATNYPWKVKGQPVPPHYVWDMTGLNFIGFSTPPVNPPNFQEFLAPDPAIAGLVQVYEYVGGNFSTNPANPAQVQSLYNTPVTRGQAFWISATNINNTYFGPFNLNLPNPNGINYGTSGGQITIHLVNATPNPLTVSLALVPSEAPPYSQTNIVAAPPLLLEGALNSSNLTYAYASLTPNGSPGASWTLPPAGQSGSDVAVVLGLNRFAMTSSAGSLYAGILRFTDSLGFSEIDVPVSATASDNSGLWVGSASVNQVSYDLKTYATNADGSWLISAVTNQVLTTNYTTLGVTTNLAIYTTTTTSQAIDSYDLTNLVISTYTTNVSQIGTNSFVLSTNLQINTTSTSNVVIETEVMGSYFTNNGGLLVWVTANTTNGTLVSSTETTNQAVLTNHLAALLTNGAPVAVTNFWVYNYTVTNQITTNGLFSGPVTYLLAVNYSQTNPVTGTNPAFDVFGTNLVRTVLAVTTNWLAGSNPQITSYTNASQPVAAIFAVTNPPTSSVYVFTNYYPVPQPLFLQTNGARLISINAVTNNYLVNSTINHYFTTNYQVISNSYALVPGATNLSSSVTNLIASVTTGVSSPISTFYTSLSLAIATNAYYVVSNSTMVSSYSNYVMTAYNTNLDAVTTPYPLRLIVFNDSSGHCSLLQRVYYGLRQDTNIVVATTEQALDPAHLNVARRITATHLPWAATNTPWGFTGSLSQGVTLSTTVIEPYDDQAVNPFLHTYHPDHNNLDMTLSPPHELSLGSESYTIKRNITLTVTPSGTDFISLTLGNSSLSGIYYETITLTGLGGATKSYQTAGTFSLRRISPINLLTTQ